jgi:hypothetical protein
MILWGMVEDEANSNPSCQIVYDLRQIPVEQRSNLRKSVLELLKQYSKGLKLVRTQLNICLAQLAIRLTDWHDVLPTVMAELGSDPSGISCILEFLKILPEEVTEGRKFNLSVRSANTTTTTTTTSTTDYQLQLFRPRPVAFGGQPPSCGRPAAPLLPSCRPQARIRVRPSTTASTTSYRSAITV